jgi:molybdenum cofactor synthesis domain-containing protein
MATAALVVIGDEILSGKTVDTNTPFLVAQLRSLGVALREIAIIPDVAAAIAETVRRVSARFDYVFTSGGVGPTHDDVTMVGIAQAFAVPIVRHPRLEELLRTYYAEKNRALIERNLRMAEVPDGTTLIEEPQLRWPVLRMRNVYVLPGIPEIFRRKFLAIAESFRDAPFHLRQLFVRSEEAVIARHLDVIAGKYAEVAVGSYPLLEPAADGHRVKLTLEGKDRVRVDEAAAELLLLLGPELIVRHE